MNKFALFILFTIIVLISSLERFRVIRDLPDYEVSNKGRVRDTSGILEGDVWRPLEVEQHVRMDCGCMIAPATVGPLWGSEIQPKPRS